MVREDNQLYRRPQMTGQARDEEEDRWNDYKNHENEQQLQDGITNIQLW